MTRVRLPCYKEIPPLVMGELGEPVLQKGVRILGCGDAGMRQEGSGVFRKGGVRSQWEVATCPGVPCHVVLGGVGIREPNSGGLLEEQHVGLCPPTQWRSLM